MNEHSSASLAQTLQQRGYKNARALVGGLDAWSGANMPVESKQRAA
jgi:rhodanese-related sulfurtransferase